MARFSLPPGFGFHPTDEELVAYYLKRKVHGHKIELDIIPEVDLYKCEPWDLPDKICIPSKDLQWHFFCARDRKYPNGSRTNRATEAGYWKATGKDRKVNSQRGKIGTKKTLVFYRGRAPFGERTDWVMHEYRLDECQVAAGLQDSFVLCRVVKKNGLETKSGDQPIAQTENNDSSCAKNNTFPGNLALTSCTENQSQERSSPILQEDENETKLSFSKTETPSATFNDMTEDSDAIERWLDVLLDDPDQNGSLTSPVESTNNTKVAVAQEVQQIISYPLQPFDWIPDDVEFNMSGNLDHCQLSKTLETSFEEAEIIEELLHTAEASQADNTEVDYFLYSNIDDIDEILRGEDLGDDILPSLEELEYHDTSVVQFSNHTNPEVTGIQLRQRRLTYQQELPFDGTAMKRVRLQKYPMQGSAVEHQQDGYIAYPNNDYNYDLQEQLILLDSFNGQNHNSKIMTQLQDPVPLAPARQTNTIREGHVPDHLRGPLTNESLGLNLQKAHSVRGLSNSFSGDNSQPGTSSMGVRKSPANEIQHILHGSEFDFSPNSTDIPDRVTVNHVISSMPPQPLTYGLFLNSQSSEIVDIPAESPTQMMKHEPGNSMDVWKSQKRELTPPTEDKIRISKIKSEVGQHSTVAVVQNCEIAPSEYDSETPNQFGKPSKGSSPGEVPDSPGSSSRVLHPEKMLSAPSSSEPISVGGGWKTSGRILKLCRSIPSQAASVMGYLRRFNPMKAILPSEFAYRKTHVAADSVGNMRTCKCTEGNMEHARSDIFFSRLTHRVKSRVKSVMPDSGEKTGDATQRFCNCCADQGNGSALHGLEQPSGVLNGFSEFLSRRAPTSSTSVIVSVCLLGTTILLFLFLLFRGIWRFARSVSAIIF